MVRPSSKYGTESCYSDAKRSTEKKKKKKKRKTIFYRKMNKKEKRKTIFRFEFRVRSKETENRANV
ncbi:uncharacterized protein RNJ42_01242 [Nakaseomyces bracarensis]|uniref:uncharacterized protein n=1 Tax=Nakaseomyces bracarensis TaxID=273131 RepID=UPI0038711FFD